MHQVAICRRSGGSRHGKGIQLVFYALRGVCDPNPVNDGKTINCGPGVVNGVTQATPCLSRR